MYRIAYCILLAAFAVLLFSLHGPVSYDDALRHIMFAQQQWHAFRAGFDINWGSFFFTGYFAQHSFDPWFLSDLFYIPFAMVGHLLIGLKIATIVQMALLMAVVIIVLKTVRVSDRWMMLALVLLMVGSIVFSRRILLGRPFVLSTCIFLLSAIVILRGRLFWLLPLTIIGTLLSHLFVFLCIQALVAACWSVLRRRFGSALRLVAYVAAGVCFGIVLHPDTVEYGRYIGQIFLGIPFAKELGLGGELYTGFLHADIGIFLVLFLSFLLFVRIVHRWGRHRLLQERPDVLYIGMLVTVFSGAFFLWVRAADMLWPLLVIFLFQLCSMDKAMEKDIERELQGDMPFPFGRLLTWQKLISVMLICSSIGIIHNTVAYDRRMSLDQFSAITALPVASRVLNIDWDIFPALFFLRPDLLYARGMDPSFDAAAHPEVLEVMERVNDRVRWTSVQDVLSRIQWDSGTFSVIRDNESLNLVAWIDQLHEAMEPDFLAVRSDLHPWLTHQLSSVSSLEHVATSDRLTVYAFVRRDGRE